MDAETLDGMTLDALDRTFEQLVALLHVTHSHILSVVTAIEDRQMPVADGAQSLGSWISAHAGLHRSTGERWAVASSKLKELPCVASAFESGALSFDQLSEVVRLATPETDAQWAEDAPPRSAASLRAMARDAERVTRQKANLPSTSVTSASPLYFWPLKTAKV